MKVEKIRYIKGLEKQLTQMYQSIKDGYKETSMEKHRLDGYIYAGYCIGFTTKPEINKIIEKAHFSIFKMTILDRKNTNEVNQVSEIDYSYFDRPTYLR